MIISVIPFWQDNVAQTEQLLEFIFAQNDRVQINGHVLLAYPPTVPADMVARIKISAELAFVGVHTLEVRPLADPVAAKWKCVNNAFAQVAEHIRKSFRWPFLWFEPDTVPTVRGWLPRLVSAYGSQPKTYFGGQGKISTPGKPDGFIMMRCGVYPVNAIQDVQLAEMPYEVSSASNVLPKLTTTKLIQNAFFVNEDDLARVRPDAIVVHGDKNGFLRRQLEVSFQPAELVPPIHIPVVDISDEQKNIARNVPVNGIKKKKGRPSKAEMDARAQQALAAVNGN